FDSVEPRAETWEKMGGDVCAIERAAARAAARTLAIAGRCDHAALLRRATAQPSKPSPSKPSVAGSGTDTAGGLASRVGMQIGGVHGHSIPKPSPGPCPTDDSSPSVPSGAFSE